MKFGICNEIFKDWSCRKGFRVYEANRIAIGSEIAPFTCAPYVTDVSLQRTRAEIKDLAAKHELEITGIHWVLVQAEGMHMTHPDESVRGRTQQYFRDLVAAVAIWEEVHHRGLPQQRNLEPEVTLEQATAWASEVFRPAVGDAKDHGITICFEPLAPSETNFMNKASEAIEFIERLPSPAFKIILDVKAMCSMGQPIPDIIRPISTALCLFSANDANLKGPGFGGVDFMPLLRLLRKSPMTVMFQ